MAHTVETVDLALNPIAAVGALIRDHGRGRVLTVDVLDLLISAAAGAKLVRLEWGDSTHLRVECDGDERLIEIDLAKAKLRNWIARLAVVCTETTGAAYQLYGGSADLIHDGTRWHANWHNTMSRQEFTLTRADRNGLVNDE